MPGRTGVFPERTRWCVRPFGNRGGCSGCAPCDGDSENCPSVSPVTPSVLVLNMTDSRTGTDRSVRTVRSLRNP